MTSLRLPSILALTVAGVLSACAYSDIDEEFPERAKPPAVDTGDLVGSSGRGLDRAMAQRGFSNVGGYQSAGASVSLWWHAEHRECFSATTRNGRVVEIGPVDRGNCR